MGLSTWTKLQANVKRREGQGKSFWRVSVPFRIETLNEADMLASPPMHDGDLVPLASLVMQIIPHTACAAFAVIARHHSRHYVHR